MPRSNVKCQFIRDANARKATLKKGKAILIKKMNELKTLYGVDACLVMYDGEDAPPQVWPSESEARRVIEEFHKAKGLGTKTIQDRDVCLESKIGKMTLQEEEEEVEEEEEEKISRNEKCLIDENVTKEANLEELESLKKIHM